MIVEADRTQLDAWLADPTTVLLMLREVPPDARARSVHDYISDTRSNGTRQYDPDWHEVLITPTSNVTAAERQAWFGSPESFGHAVLKNDSASSPKGIRWQGPIEELLFPAGDPAYIFIRRAFLR